jgi:hypothetical protein
MTDFKTYFNPLIAVGRLVFSMFFGGMTCFIIYHIFRKFKTTELIQYGGIMLVVVLFGALFQMFFVAFIKTTKNYLIKDNCIEEFNLLTLKTKAIHKEDIKGFSTSIVPYRIWDFKQIIIYLKDGTKIDIMQFAYFNFKNIKPDLIDKNYNYLGDEPYIWKWVNSRVYKYDD